MSDRLEPVALTCSGHAADAINRESQLIEEGHRRATAIRKQRRPVLDRLAAALIQREVLEGEGLERLFRETF